MNNFSKLFTIDWRSRVKNPTFWMQVFTAIFIPILTYFGLAAEDITTWQILGDTLKGALSNPFVIVSVISNVVTTITNPITPGIADSEGGDHGGK